LIISPPGFARRHLLLHQQEVFEALVTHQRHPDHRAKDHQNQRQQDAQHVRDLDKDRYLNVNVKKKGNKRNPTHWRLLH
jgi:hypothetical protein